MNKQDNKLHGFFAAIFAIFFGFGIGSIFDPGVGALAFSFIALTIGQLTSSGKIDWSWINAKQ